MGGLSLKPLFRRLEKLLNHVPWYWNHQHPDISYEQQVKMAFGRKAAQEYKAHIQKTKNEKARGKE